MVYYLHFQPSCTFPHIWVFLSGCRCLLFPTYPSSSSSHEPRVAPGDWLTCTCIIMRYLHTVCKDGWNQHRKAKPHSTFFFFFHSFTHPRTHVRTYLAVAVLIHQHDGDKSPPTPKRWPCPHHSLAQTWCQHQATTQMPEMHFSLRSPLTEAAAMIPYQRSYPEIG